MSSLLEVGLPTAEPVSLAEAMNFLKAPSSIPAAEQTLISTLITAARRYLETQTGLTLANRNFVQYEDGFPRVPLYPLLVCPPAWFYFGYGSLPGLLYPAEDARRRHFVKRLLRTPVTAISKIVYVNGSGELIGLLPGQDFLVDYASHPGRIAPLPGNLWPEVMFGPNSVSIHFSAGYKSASSDTEDISLGPTWQPLTEVAQWHYVLDEDGNVEVQTAADGTTGASKPTWADPGASMTDGSCTWLNAGPPLGLWIADHGYDGPSVFLDSNDNLQLAQAAHTSASAPGPTWEAALGESTTDNDGTCINIGLNRDAAPAPPNQLVEYKGDLGIPEDLKVAVLLLVSHFYFNRDAVAGGIATDVPHGVTAIINSNRVWDFT